MNSTAAFCRHDDGGQHGARDEPAREREDLHLRQQQAATMHGALHAIATAIALPYALLAAWFAMVGELARARGLWAVVDALFAHAGWFVGWGVYLIPLAALSLATAGFCSRLRRVAALSLALLSGSSLLTIVLLHAGPLESGHLLFLCPCVAVLLGSIWLFHRADRPARAPAAA
ncbi:hypothetical protein [Accumulibacter sp.]|uniref:hypothetical protein n=1 Tax=Accumulibacter sp. TaxID=2053492 RepID=UPI00257CF580|nr:hypothetical protein [Accumulibacter sp.]